MNNLQKALRDYEEGFQIENKSLETIVNNSFMEFCKYKTENITVPHMM